MEAEYDTIGDPRLEPRNIVWEFDGCLRSDNVAADVAAGAVIRGTANEDSRKSILKS